jgi:hypothetical protein
MRLFHAVSVRFQIINKGAQVLCWEVLLWRDNLDEKSGGNRNLKRRPVANL